METVTVKTQRPSKAARRRIAQRVRASVTTPKTVVIRETATQQVVRPPGQGLSRAARRRRNRRVGGVVGGSEQNEYLETLMDPENHPGVRVPDMVTFPSSTFQLTADFSMTPGVAAGVYGDGVVCILEPNLGYGAGNWAPIRYGTNTVAGGVYAFNNKYWLKEANIRALFDSYRPVSATMYAEYAGNSVTDSGTICMGIIPRDAGTDANLIGQFSLAQAQSYTKTIPLRNGAVVTWKPQDNKDLEYKDIQDTTQADHHFPSIFIATEGMSASAANNCNVRIRCIVNYEALPTTDTFSVLGTEKSVSHTAKLESAMNWASEAYNNMSAFVTTISPFVQPVLNKASTAATTLGVQYLQNSLASGRGNSLRLRY